MTQNYVFQKHSCTDNWSTYLKAVEAFKAEQNPDVKDEFAEIAREEYNVLKKFSFFAAYTNLRKEWLGLHSQIANHLDLMLKWIKKAAGDYFTNKFGIPESCITFGNTTEGSRSAIVCNVNVEGTLYKYRMKTNHGAGTSSRGNFVSKFCFIISLINFSNLVSFRISFQIKFDRTLHLQVIGMHRRRTKSAVHRKFRWS